MNDDKDMPSDGGTTTPSNKRQKGRNSRDNSCQGSTRRHGGSKGRDAMDFEPASKDSTWIARSDYDPSFPLAPSAKTTALKAILLKGFIDAPLDKVNFLQTPIPNISQMLTHLTLRSLSTCNSASSRELSAEFARVKAGTSYI